MCALYQRARQTGGGGGGGPLAWTVDSTVVISLIVLKKRPFFFCLPCHVYGLFTKIKRGFRGDYLLFCFPIHQTVFFLSILYQIFLAPCVMWRIGARKKKGEEGDKQLANGPDKRTLLPCITCLFLFCVIIINPPLPLFDHSFFFLSKVEPLDSCAATALLLLLL